MLHREVGKALVDYCVTRPGFGATWNDLRAKLETDPKQFPKKRGKLQLARAASLRHGGVVFRGVFIVREHDRIVRVLALDPHDKAYENAVRRLRR